jgi:hypothetical protein
VVQPATLDPLRSLEAGYCLGKGRAKWEVMGPVSLRRIRKVKGPDACYWRGHPYENAQPPQTCVLLPYDGGVNMPPVLKEQ